MKKMYPFIIATLLVMISCSDDDSTTAPDPSIDASLIIGRWDLEDSDIDGTTVLQVSGQPVTVTGNTVLTSATFNIAFLADGSYNGMGQSSYLTTTPGLPNQVTDSDIASAVGNYAITGNTIVFTGDSFFGAIGDADTDFDNVTFTISTLTSTQMILDVVGTVEQDLLGTTSSIDVDGFIEFTKQ